MVVTNILAGLGIGSVADWFKASPESGTVGGTLRDLLLVGGAVALTVWIVGRRHD